MVPEVCHIYCATANPVEVIIAETDQGQGILGVVDGLLTKGIEGDRRCIYDKVNIMSCPVISMKDNSTSSNYYVFYSCTIKCIT